VAELVDALASGASGLTAVKVRVLSWAPLAHAHDFAGNLSKRLKSLICREFEPLTGMQNQDTAR
jgi:hypothetical protein